MKNILKYTIKIVASCLLLTGLASASEQPAAILTVSSISQMQSLGTASIQYPTIYVTGLQGGTFSWVSGSLPCNSVTGGGDEGTTFCADNGTGGYLTTGYWQRQYHGSVNITWFGAKCDGSTDDSSAFKAAVAAFTSVYVPPSTSGCVISNITVPANTSIFGSGYNSLLVEKVGSGEAFLLSNDKPSITNLHIDLNGGTYGILSWDIASPYVGQVTFTGLASAALVFGCDHANGFGYSPVSQNNVFDNRGQNSPMGQGILFEGCRNFLSSGDKFYDVGGFPIETLWSSGVIDHVKTYSPDLGSTQTATSGQTNFTFTTSEQGCSRYGLQINAHPTYINGTTVTITHNATYSSFSVTVPARTSGDLVRFICFRQLESLSINSGSGVYAAPTPVSGSGSGISIISPDINGTGDTGIALSCDYHWNGSTWIEGACGSAADLPGNITITNPVITNTLLSSIQSYSGQLGLDVSGYQFSNFGLSNQNEAILSSGITVTYTYSSASQLTRIGSGVIDNTSGFGLNGITVNGTSSIETGSFSKQIEIYGEPAFKGTFTSQFSIMANLSLADDAAIVASVTDVARPPKLYIGQPDWDTAVTSGKPTNTSFLTYSVNGSGVASDSTNKQGGQNSILTIVNSSLDMSLLSESSTTSVFSGKILRFKFWAKSTSTCVVASTCSYVSVFGSANSNTQHPFTTVYIDSTSWKQYEIDVSMQNLDYLYLIRVGCPPSGITANLQYPELGTIDLN